MKLHYTKDQTEYTVDVLNETEALVLVGKLQPTSYEIEHSLSETIQSKRALVDEELEKRLVGSFMGETFEIDESSAGYLNKALSVAETAIKVYNMWPGQHWTTADNKKFHIKDIDMLRLMVVTLGAQGNSLFEARRLHKEAISSLPDVQSVKDYDISQNWPSYA